MAILGVLGYIFARIECEPAPMLLGLILGPMMEEHLQRALLISRGDPTIFFQRPISIVILVLAITSLRVVISPSLRAKREEAFKDE